MSESTAEAQPAFTRSIDAEASVRELGQRRGVPVSFVILTKNEERNLNGCLDSIRGYSDDVHVLDSGSEDKTAAIAESRGIPVYVHPFRGFGSQRNWAIDHIPHRHEWLFHLDADERLTPALADEIARVLAQDPEEAGFFVASKLMFRGRWLRRSGGYPNYQVRLFHRGRLRFVDYGHGQRELATGRLGYLQEPYLHDAFSKGLDDWLRKHAGYAKREAEEYAREANESLVTHVRRLFHSDPVVRRRATKSLSYRLPCRPTLRLIDILIVKRAILDGPAGIAHARMLAAYESMFAAHLAVLRCRPHFPDETDAGDEPSVSHGKGAPRHPR